MSLNDAKISKEKKTALYNLLKKNDTIILKNDNDIGQIDLIEMHITTSLYIVPVAAQPYPMSLKHHKFLKQKSQIW